MLQRIKRFFTPNHILEEREREAILLEREENRRKMEEQRRQRCYEWAKKHIKRWGVWKYKYVYIVENPDRDYDDESTLYKPVYSNGKMGVPDRMVCYFHISELFPWKSDEEYYKSEG
jgi:hypothetical protein